LGQAGINEQKV